MAKPRVFISSTYFDLRTIRDDVSRNLESLGFEATIHERGDVPYSSTKTLEDNCYREINNCDIVVSVIGGRYGTASSSGEYSISQMELKTALELQRQVYIFVEEAVYHEYRTYSKNIGNDSIRYSSVDNHKVFAFLEEVYALPQNNAVASFRVSEDITRYLRAQLSGLFQRLLSERAQLSQGRAIQDLRAATETLSRLISTSGEEKQLQRENIKYIRLMNHPLFKRLASLLLIKYRVFFTTLNELDDWLGGRKFIAVSSLGWDEPSVREWINSRKRRLLKIPTELFDDSGELLLIDESTWDSSQVRLEPYEASNEEDIVDDEIPF